VVADFRSFGSGWGREEGAQFQVDVPQGDVVGEESLVDFGEPLQDGGIGGKVLSAPSVSSCWMVCLFGVQKEWPAVSIRG
jgi:hypothetical protein